jgi:succinate dehydrogenase / fumarate reductase flavoprotein subunit
MSESLRNDGRVWVPKKAGDQRSASQIPEDERDYFLERIYPTFGNLVPRDIASRAAKRMVDNGHSVVPGGSGVYLDFRDAIQRLGEKAVSDRYGNLFEMYERITGDSPFQLPMKIYPASHYTMGGLWVDYNLMSNVPGLFVIGEANFSDHGANRLGASALMQGLADGYFVLPYTIGDYLAGEKGGFSDTNGATFSDAEREAKGKLDRLLSVKGKTSADVFHRRMGKIVWEGCGMGRSAAGLQESIRDIRALREEFWQDVNVPGTDADLNQALERAGRVADFLEFSEVLCLDALTREESCGGHFREEHQTPEGEALRDDERFCHSAIWMHDGEGQAPRREIEPLEFKNVPLTQRSYK